MSVEDQLTQARGELAKAEQAVVDAEAEARQYAATGDFQMAQNARRAARTAEGKATDLRERCAALEAEQSAAEQAKADEALRKATKAAEKAAKAQADVAAEAPAVLEQMRDLERRLDAAISETSRKVNGAYAAAEAAGRDLPAVSVPLAEGRQDARKMIEQAKRLGRIVDRAERSGMQLGEMRRNRHTG